ncbi:MAG TPA: helix-turn-helix transcriptional regulator [Bryobacteraceae bacterium]
MTSISEKSLTVRGLRVRRRECDVSLDLLGQSSGIHFTRISRILNGAVKPDPGELAKLDDAINGIVQQRKKLVQLAESAGLELEAIGILL